MHTWGLALPLAAEGWGYMVLRNRLPAPETSWNWKWDFTSSAEEWAERIAWYRAMIFEDQSILRRRCHGRRRDRRRSSSRAPLAMMNNNSTYHTTSPSPSVELSMSRAADELGKPIEEVFGYIAHPVGRQRLQPPPVGASSTRWPSTPTSIRPRWTRRRVCTST